ncbi:MAG TPA: hypothetical protein VGG89_01745 [Candidatus Baltobacteraceae bacterium]|jgi:hypothetical protein
MYDAPRFKPRVLEDLLKSQTPVIALVAPAGFGKSELARAFARRFDRPVVLHGRKDIGAAELLADLPEPADCVVLESAEQLDDDVWKEVIELLLETREEGGAIVICTRREPLQFSFIDVVAPHNLIVLRTSELELTFDELLAWAPSNAQSGNAALVAIYYLTRGWPVPSLAMLKLIERGLFSESFSVKDPALTDLFNWLESHVIETLSPEIRDAVFRAVAARDMTPKDFDRRIAQQSVLGIAGEIRVRRLLALLVTTRYRPELEHYTREAVERFMGQGEPLRAARALIVAGDLAAAARVLDEMPFDETQNLSGFAYPGMELEHFSGSVPEYERYPLLWLQLIPARFFVVPSLRLAREGARILERHDHLPERTWRWIASVTAMLFVEAGDVPAAEMYAPPLNEIDASPAEDAALRDLAHMYLASAYGRYREVQNRWLSASRFLNAVPSWYALHLRAALNAQIRLGTMPGVQEIHDMFNTLAHLGAYQGYAAYGAMMATFVAWLAKDREAFTRHRREFAHLAHLYAVPALWPLLGAMWGRDFSNGKPSLVLDSRSAIVLAAETQDPQHVLDYARRAIVAADGSGDYALRILSRVFAYERGVPNGSAILKEAAEMSAASDSPAIRTAMLAYLAGGREVGMLRPFVERTPVVTNEERILWSKGAKLTIDVARGDVRRNGNFVRVSEGTRQLLVLLALIGPVRRDAVIDRLWPDLDGDRAINALKVCVHRARMQLHDAGAIVVSQSVIALGQGITSNYAEILELAATSDPLNDALSSHLADTLAALVAGLTSQWAPWEWFVPYRNRLVEAMHAIGARLIDHELAHGRKQAASHVASAIAGINPSPSS